MAPPVTPVVKNAPIFCSCRIMIVVCCMMIIINVVFVRVNFSLNYLCMNHIPELHEPKEQSMARFNDEHGVQTFNWSKHLIGYLISSYYVGYLLSCLIGGYYSDLWGGRLPILLGCGVQSILFILECPASYFGPYWFLGTKMLNGVFSGLSFVPVFTLFAKWIHPKERVLLVSIALSAFPLATIFVFPLTAFLCQYGFRGWESNFYVPGLFGIITTIMCFFFVYDNPTTHPRVSSIEKEYLLSFGGNKRPSYLPWLKLFTTLPIWAFYIAQIAQVWNWQCMVLNMPSFFTEAYRFNHKEVAFACSCPFVALLVVRMLIAFSFYPMYECCGLSLTRFYKINHMIGTVIPSLSLLALIFLELPKFFVILLVVIDQSIVDFATSGAYLPSLLDMAPEYAATISGVGTTMSFALSSLSPVVVGHLTPNATKEEWNRVLFLQMIFLMTSCIFYEIFGSSHRVSWIDKNTTPPAPAVESFHGLLPASGSINYLPPVVHVSSVKVANRPPPS